MLPQDIGGAREFLARDDKTMKEVENWVCGLIKACPQGGGKSGAYGGDGDGPRAVNTALRHGNPYKRAAREADTGAQGALDL